jgi:hypothetical protein
MNMSTVDLKLLVHDPMVMADGILFSSPAFRARYLGTENRRRANWLSENPDKWVRVTTSEEAALRAGTECNVEIGPDSLPRLKLLRDEPSKPQDAEISKPEATKDRSAVDDATQGVTHPQPASPTPSPNPDEIVIDGRRLFSARHAAAILGKSERTLQRWHAKNYGPPRTKIGSGIFYDERKLYQWIQDH